MAEFLAVIFSKDRPLQLQGCLESLRRFIKPLHEIEISVICCVSDERYMGGYRQLEKRYDHVKFHYERNEADSRFEVFQHRFYAIVL